MAIVRSLASTSVPRCAYDVFLSFRGVDTGKTFTDHLYAALVQAGFHTFRDDDDIVRGESIESELQKALEQSRISIIVFSKTFAASRWCLNQLLNILHCKRTSRQEVLPIFYDVDPSDIRKQTGSFAEAFTRHEKQFGAEADERNGEWIKKVDHWRAALKEVSDLAGMVLQNQSDGHEAKFIQKIVKVIRDKLNRRVLSVTPFLIGILPLFKKINLWLRNGAMDAGVITICGMGGIGKTAIAKFVYNLNRENFDGSSFLANIRERSQEPNGLVKLQQLLLSDIGKQEKLSCVDEGIVKIADAICCKRLLLVLDDVDQVYQLDAVLGMRHLFCPGSKIIITTRHKQLLNPHEVHQVHQVRHLNYEDSLELFSWHAFGQTHPPDDYLKLSIRVVHHCGGLPLALQVLGSSLSRRSINMWESSLKKLEAIPDSQILRKLMISYDCLQDDHDKELFLHIACFFVGRDRDWTIKILDECDFFTTIGIQNLVDTCLLTINVFNELEMHKLLKDMGREIVRRESPKEPGRRSRLWYHNDCFNVLREKTGTNIIEGLILDMHVFEEDEPSTTGSSFNFAKGDSKETLQKSFFSDLGKSLKRRVFNRFSWHPVKYSLRNSSALKFIETDAFSEMNQLKLLQLNYAQITGCFKKFPKALRWFCWHGFPLRTIPSELPTESLVALDMRYSKLTQVWKGIKFFKVLKILDLSHSHGLIKTPEFSGVPNLEKLILEDCVSLVKVHKSIGKLERLVLLNLKDCETLEKLPQNICKLRSLETLIISGCPYIDWRAIHRRTMGSVVVLDACGIAPTQYTSEEVESWQGTIWSWVSNPRRCLEISPFKLPCSLVKLSLAGCNLFDDDFPLDFSNLSSLQYLDLSANQICSLPVGVRDLTGLQTLIVDSCKKLISLTDIANVRLKKLSATGCSSLEKISYHSTFFGPSNLSCRYCDNLVSIDGHFKLEPMNSVDLESLKAWGFSNLESAVTYFNIPTTCFRKKLRFQKLYERGVYSYFLHGDKIPSGFSIKSIGSSLSFIVPTLNYYKIRGLIVCCVYTPFKTRLMLSDALVAMHAVVENKTKNVKCVHCPLCWGVPASKGDMIWISHWNFGDMLDGGDVVEVSVIKPNTVFRHTPEKMKSFVAKEVGILLLYECQEEMGTQSMHEAAVQENFPYQDMVTGDVSKPNFVYFGGWRGKRQRRQFPGGPPQKAYYSLFP